MERLIVSEKPSVGMAIAKTLGKFQKREGYLEGDGWIVSWCVGHLVEQADAEEYDSRYAKWNLEDLPIIPKEWRYRVTKATRKQYEILAELMKNSGVEELVNACDSGREGELILRLVYQQCGCTKPVKRLWLSSMEESAIRNGMNNLRESADFDSLYRAALCRQQADWLTGINATRLFTLLYRGKTLNIGRVMTPTLALIAERENAVRGFKKEKFYTVELNCGGFYAVSERFDSKSDAEKLRAVCVGTSAVVRSVERKEKTENPPKLYDLTTLQREANRIYGFTAQKTLNIVQNLYEKKLVTYPRTDSRYLTEDMKPSLPDLCQISANILPFVTDEAKKTLSVNADVVIDNNKVSDHHAIIPTKEIAKTDISALTPDERTVLFLISARLLCAVGKPFRYAETVANLDCGGVSFSAKGRAVLDDGWKLTEKAFRDALKNDDKLDDESAAPLPALSEGESVKITGAAVKEGTTKPPARFTEDTLLRAMERADADAFAKIENPERVGLGTPATRARIIEKLVNCQYIERKKRQIVPTELGLELIRVLPERLKSARLTSEWEAKLKQVERGELNPDVFMTEIETMTRDFVKNTENPPVKSEILSQSARPAVGICPRCGKKVVEGPKSFYCEGYYSQPSCGFALWKNDRFFKSKGKTINKTTAEKLLKNGRVHMTKLRSEKTGNDYDADIIMDDTGGKYVNFRLEFDRKAAKSGGRKASGDGLKKSGRGGKNNGQK